MKVWAAQGWKARRHPERLAEWLLIEWPEGAESPGDYWLADLGPQPVGLRRLVRTARARWRVELDCRELKEELGLDHYEGRHWLGAGITPSPWSRWSRWPLPSCARNSRVLKKTSGVTLPQTPGPCKWR